jgi:hypothetical protein
MQRGVFTDEGVASDARKCQVASGLLGVAFHDFRSDAQFALGAAVAVTFALVLQLTGGAALCATNDANVVFKISFHFVATLANAGNGHGDS